MNALVMLPAFKINFLDCWITINLSLNILYWVRFQAITAKSEDGCLLKAEDIHFQDPALFSSC